MRWLLLTFGGAAVLAGCLFPSFDDLKGNGGAPSGDDDDSAPSDSGTKASSTSSTSGGTSSSSSSSSGAPPTMDGATTTPKTIACGNKVCNADQFCCGSFTGDTSCVPATGNHSCDTLMKCDGAQDCGPGMACCQDGFGGSDTLCRPGKCDENEYTMCQADAPICPNGQKCTGPHTAIYGAEPKTCE